jgi:chromate transporter
LTLGQDGALHQGCPPWKLFVIWCRLSLLSFGGGVATLGLIRQEIVDRRRWFSEEEFLRDWSLCQLAPGINLIAITILIGKRVGGGFGAAASLIGLLLPSGAATIAITAAYAHFANSPFVVAARSGIVPAVAGVGLATAVSMLIPIVRRHQSDGIAPSLAYGILLVGCFCAQAVFQLSPVLVILAAGVLGALYNVSGPKLRESAS